MASNVNGESVVSSKDDSSTARKIFEEWMVKHGKSYPDETEKEKRFEIFREKWRYIEDFNSEGNRSYWLGLNDFSDLTQEEFSSAYTGFCPQLYAADDVEALSQPAMKLMIVEMGVGYDQHGQDITAAAMSACRDAISSNSIPAFQRGSISGVTLEQMKVQIKLGVPHALQQFLDIDRVKSVFPYGEIIGVEVVDGGMICPSGVLVEEMGDKNEDCYIVNAAVYVGY